jgi:hypothetical protein
LAVGVFGVGLTGWYFGDDLGYIIEPDSLYPLTYFARANLDGWYRPLQMAFLSAVQTRYGLWTVPIHLTYILLHAVTTGFVYSLARRFGLGVGQAVLAAIFFLVAQANAIAVLSIDTLSSICATLFGLITLWLLVPGDFSAESVALRRLSQYCFAPLTFLLSLLSKESGVSVWPMAVVCLAAFPEVAHSKPIDWRRKRQLILVALPLLLVLLLYLVLRSATGATPAGLCSRVNWPCGTPAAERGGNPIKGAPDGGQWRGGTEDSASIEGIHSGHPGERTAAADQPAKPRSEQLLGLCCQRV